MWGRACLLVCCLLLVRLCVRAQADYTDVREWIAALHSKDPKIRLGTMFAFDYRPKDSLRTAEILLKELNSPDSGIVRPVVYVLGENRIMPSRAIPALIGLMEKPHAEDETRDKIRMEIAAALPKYGPRAVKPTVQLLDRLTAHAPNPRPNSFYSAYPDNAVLYAAIALGRMGPPVLPFLVKKGPENRVREECYYWIRQQVSDNLSGEELAEDYRVGKEFRLLMDLLSKDPGLPDLALAKSALDTLLRADGNVVLGACQLINEPVHIGASVKLASFYLSHAKRSSCISLIDGLEDTLLFDATVLNAIFSRMTAQPDSDVIRRLVGRAQNSEIFYYKHPTVRLSALNALSEFLQSGGTAAKDVLTLVSLLDPPVDEQIGDSTPIVKALLELEKHSPVHSPPELFDALYLYSQAPVVRRALTARYRNGELTVIRMFYDHPELIDKKDTLLATYLAGELEKRPGRSTGPVSREQEMVIGLEIVAAGQMDTCFAPLLVKGLGDILNDTGFRRSYPEFLPLTMGTLLKLGEPGKQYALGYSDGADSVALGLLAFNLSHYQPDPTWNKIVINLFNHRDRISNRDWGSIWDARLTKESYPLLPYLLNELDKHANDHGLTPLITHAIGSIGDTIVPYLLTHYIQTTDRLNILLSFSHEKYPVLDTLLDHLFQSKIEGVREVAIRSLRGQLKDAERYRTVLQSALCDPDPALNLAALEVIRDLGEKGKPFVQGLMALARDRSRSPVLGMECLFALVNISVDARPAAYFPRWDGDRELYTPEIIGSPHYRKISAQDTVLIGFLLSLTGRSHPLAKCAYKLLGLADTLTPAIRAALGAGLLEADSYAAEAAVNLGITGNEARLAAVILYDAELSRDMYAAIKGLNFTVIAQLAGGGGPIEKLQPLSWPPPQASTRGIIPARLFVREHTIGDVCAALIGALAKCRYPEYSLFSVEGGFAMLTRVERIEDNGSPSKRGRWTRQQLAPLNIAEYMRSLLMGEEGNFRAILFVVTPLGNFRDNGVPLMTADQGDSLFKEGGQILPDTLAKESFQNKFVHVLIYQFYKRHGEVNILHDPDKVIPAIAQLEATELIKAL